VEEIHGGACLRLGCVRCLFCPSHHCSYTRLFAEVYPACASCHVCCTRGRATQPVPLPHTGPPAVGSLPGEGSCRTLFQAPVCSQWSASLRRNFSFSRRPLPPATRSLPPCPNPLPWGVFSYPSPSHRHGAGHTRNSSAVHG